MRIFTFKYFYFTMAVLMMKTALSQVPDFSKVPLLHTGDSLNITYLINNGVKWVDGKVICWFPKDSLSTKKMKDISTMLNAGIVAAEKFISAPLTWQLKPPDQPYTFYFRYDRFISHASQAGFVSIPYWRIKESKAPWLHEIIHEMLYTKSGSWLGDEVSEKEWLDKMPLWLFEGLPDYIALTVSLKEDLQWFDVISDSDLTNYDSLFIQDIKTDSAGYILSYIGKGGVLPQLYSDDRSRYAPAFYHGSTSFVKFIAENFGISILLTSISEFKKEEATIEKLTGKSLEVLKKEWLDKLKRLK